MPGSSQEIVIRTADISDLPAIAALRSLWSTGACSDPEFEQQLGSWFADEGDRRMTWLAWIDELAVGMASMFEYRRMPHPGRLESRWGYVSNMFVRVEFRGRGIGSAMLEQVIAVGRERRFARLVLSPSAESISLYQRAGFVSPDQTSGRARLLVRLGDP